MTQPTTIPALTAVDFANRLVQTFPPGWSSGEAKTPGGALYALLGTLGTGLSFENGGVRYALNATRIQTAENGALDLVAQDFFGDALPRNPGEGDASYRARILAAILPAGATRSAVTNAVKAVTGFEPRVIEPWSPKDTGAWDLFYWDVDNAQTPFRWTGSARPEDFNLAYQGFIECSLPTPALLGGNAVPCFDSNFFWDTAGSSLIDLDTSVTLGPQVVYDAINATKCEGTIVWVKFVPAPSDLNWDQPGVNWDQPGATWG